MSKKSNKAFIDKIKTLTIGTGAKASENYETQFCGIEKAELHAVCAECGETVEKTEIPVAVFRRRRKHKTDGEQAFSA